MFISIVIFVLSFILFWADLFFVQYAWMNFNDTAFRIAEIFLIIFVVIIAISGIIVIKNVVVKVKSKKFFAVCLSFALLLIVVFCSVKANSVLNSFEQISASTNIYSKDSDGDKYYISLVKDTDIREMVKMECDRKTYDSIIVDENVQYQIEYRLNALDEGKSSLYHIDVDNYIDNR